MRNHNNQSSQKNQQGIVAILVTMILMIVLTLIVLSFAKVSRREQRNALDRQLSTQAFYAAESGINFAKKQLQANPGLAGDFTDTCRHFTDTLVPPVSLPQTVGPASSNSSYTCLFANSTPLDLKFTKTNAQIIFPFKPTTGPSDLTIFWDDASGGSAFNGCSSPGSNPASQPGSCNASIMRVEVTNITSSKVFFVYPSNVGSQASFDFSSTATGSASSTICPTPIAGAPQKCSVVIKGATGTYIRVKGIYGAIAVTAVANSGSPLAEAQALIDATGKAADVERRIQVRVSISGMLKDPPPYVLEGTDKICKKFSIDGATATDDGSCSTGTFPD